MNKDMEMGKYQRGNPVKNKLQWSLLVLVQLKDSPHLQNMISSMAINTGVTPLPPQCSSKIPV